MNVQAFCPYHSPELQKFAVETAGLSVLNRAAVSVEARLEAFTQIFPFIGLIGSDELNYEIPRWGPHDFSTHPQTAIASGGNFPIVEPSADTVTGTLSKRGITVKLGWEKLSGADQARMRKQDQASQELGIKSTLYQLNNEAATLLQASGATWGTETTASPAWTDSSADIIDDMETFLDAVALTMGGTRPNKIWLNDKKNWTLIKNHSSVRDRINPTSPESVQLDMFASIFDMPSGSIGYSDLAVGGSAMYSQTDIWAGFVDESENEYLPSAVRTPRWTAVGGSNAQPYRTRREYVFFGGAGGDDFWAWRTEGFWDIITTTVSGNGAGTHVIQA